MYDCSVNRSSSTGYIMVMSLGARELYSRDEFINDRSNFDIMYFYSLILYDLFPTTSVTLSPAFGIELHTLHTCT